MTKQLLRQCLETLEDAFSKLSVGCYVHGYHDTIGALHKELAKPEAEVVAWMDVDGFVNKYEVSSEGQIRNKLTGKLAPQNATVGAGYTKADFWQDGKHIQTTVHRVVATAFLGPADGREVNHKNGIKSDNRLSNLEWVSKSRNTIHRYYELESTIHPIVSICTTTGKKTKYESVALAVKDGFLSSAIYKCLSGGVHRKHRGFHFIDAKADTSPPDTRAKDKALRVALEALKFAYNGCESDLIRDENIYPAILQIEALGVK